MENITFFNLEVLDNGGHGLLVVTLNWFNVAFLLCAVCALPVFVMIFYQLKRLVGTIRDFWKGVRGGGIEIRPRRAEGGEA
jgi:hypothetical protein